MMPLMDDPAACELTLYFDLGSPYAYLALERAEAVLGRSLELEPVLVGAMFAWRGWGSWGRGPERARGMAEVQERAQRYGLDPIAWPSGWPTDGLAAMRAATWAKQQRRAEQFARAVFRRQFGQGADIAERAVLAECAALAELDPRSMLAAIESPEIKEALKQATQRAWAAGVRGIPSLRAGAVIWYGDDRLEQAAAQLRA